MSARATTLTLWALLALDVTIATVALGFPGLWYHVFHGAWHGSPPGDLVYLRRTGAQWAGFALVQAIALARWRRDPRWLAAVGGVRLCDIFTDALALAVMPSRTVFAWIALALTGPANAAIGALLIRSSAKIQSKNQ
jgi:hypothetical protein